MIASAWVGAIAWWLDHDEDLDPADMASAFLQFSAHGYLRSMGFDRPPG